MDGTTYARAASALWRRVGSDVLVADPRGLDIEQLSLPASRAWLLLGAPRTSEALTTELAREFATSPEEVAAHVADVLETFERRGWAVRGTASETATEVDGG